MCTIIMLCILVIANGSSSICYYGSITLTHYYRIIGFIKVLEVNINTTVAVHFNNPSCS